jgi:hypothetical protein
MPTPAPKPNATQSSMTFKGKHPLDSRETPV